jgi:PilZ domain-containing protein
MLLTIEPDSSQHIHLTNDGSERRRGLRIAQHRPIKVFEPTAMRFIGGLTEDVSVTGLRIVLPRSAPLREGSTLAVHVGLDDMGQPLANRRDMMPARVVWLRRGNDPTGKSMTAGIEWTADIAVRADAA